MTEILTQRVPDDEFSQLVKETVAFFESLNGSGVEIEDGSEVASLLAMAEEIKVTKDYLRIKFRGENNCLCTLGFGKGESHLLFAKIKISDFDYPKTYEDTFFYDRIDFPESLRIFRQSDVDNQSGEATLLVEKTGAGGDSNQSLLVNEHCVDFKRVDFKSTTSRFFLKLKS